MEPIVQQLAQESKSHLLKVYGSELAEPVLYGSYARGDQRAESDVDFAIVLHRAEVSTTELLKTAPISTKLSVKYGLMISSLPVSLLRKQTSMQPIFQNIREEGIAV